MVNSNIFLSKSNGDIPEIYRHTDRKAYKNKLRWTILCIFRFHFKKRYIQYLRLILWVLHKQGKIGDLPKAECI